MLKKYLLALLGLGVIIAWLSIDEGFGYLGSILIVVVLSSFVLWRIPKNAKNKSVPSRLGRIFLNVAFGIVLFFITLEREVNNLNFAYNSEFRNGVVSNIAIDRCQKSLKKKRGYTDCWKIQVTVDDEIYRTTSFTENEYKLYDVVQVLVAGPAQNDFLSYDWVPFFGDAYTRISYEIHNEQFDQRQHYLNELKSNFGFVMGVFSIALILFGLRWITVLGIKYEPNVQVKKATVPTKANESSGAVQTSLERKTPTFSDGYRQKRNLNDPDQ